MTKIKPLDVLDTLKAMGPNAWVYPYSETECPLALTLKTPLGMACYGALDDVASVKEVYTYHPRELLPDWCKSYVEAMCKRFTSRQESVPVAEMLAFTKEWMTKNPVL